MFVISLKSSMPFWESSGLICDSWAHLAANFDFVAMQLQVRPQIVWHFSLKYVLLIMTLHALNCLQFKCLTKPWWSFQQKVQMQYCVHQYYSAFNIGTGKLADQ